MRKMDSPAVILVMSFVMGFVMTHNTHIRLPVTCSEKPAKAGIIIEVVAA